ncbi:MAG: DUF1444 family protein [Rhizobacter sp.]
MAEKYKSTNSLVEKEKWLAAGLAKIKLALLAAGLVLVVQVLPKGLGLHAPILTLQLALLAAAFSLGSWGLSQVARVIKLGWQAQLLGRLALILPVVNVVFLGSFLLRRTATHKRLKQEILKQQLTESVPEAANKPNQPEAAPRGGTSNNATALERASRVLPRIVQAHLPPDTDGNQLSLRLSGLEKDLPESSQPVMWITEDGFAVFYLVDEGSHYQYLTREELRKSGMKSADLHRQSLRNLSALANADRPGLTLIPQIGFNGLVMGGEFESSLILVPELWDTMFASKTPTSPVVCIPSRDICAFCDAGSKDGVAQLKALAEKAFSSGKHPITDQIFVREDGRWINWTESKVGDLPPLEFEL